ncbi:MAG: DNA polymerase III subunit [Armatimonadetes bacterium]|nr:DNA polymerase III subunit [Armatimonadota bacterium]
MVRRLDRALRAGRVSHAYLFLGPAGSGKTTAARLLAQACNCASLPAPGAPGHPGLAPCGSCIACRQIAAGTYPDVIEVLPGSGTGQNVSVLQARELRTQAALRPRQGRRRLFIFPTAELLSDVAANALLKTLEEPPDFATLVLAAPGPAVVLPTIRSRCQIVRFGVAAPAALAGALQERFHLPLAEAERLARYSGGRPGAAITWAQAPEEMERRRRALDLFAEALAARGETMADLAPGDTGVAALRLAEQARVPMESGAPNAPGEGDEEENPPAAPTGGRFQRGTIAAVLSAGLAYLRDLVLLRAGAPESLIQHTDRLPELSDLAHRLEPGYPLWAAEQVREAQRLLERNVTPALVLERLFLNLLLARGPWEV